MLTIDSFQRWQSAFKFVTETNLLNNKIILIEDYYDRITLNLMDIIHKK